jgi:hypothetical protein
LKGKELAEEIKEPGSKDGYKKLPKGPRLSRPVYALEKPTSEEERCLLQ